MSLSIAGIDFGEIKELDLNPQLYKAVLENNTSVLQVKRGFKLQFYSINNMEGAKHKYKIESAYNYDDGSFFKMRQNEKSRYFSRAMVGNGLILPITEHKTKLVFGGHVPFPKMGSGFKEEWEEIDGVWTLVDSGSTYIS